MMKVLCILFARGLLVLCVCGLEHSMFTVPRDSVASFYTSAALQVWSYYPALFQSVYPTLPRRLAPLLPFGWANRTLLITLRVAFAAVEGFEPSLILLLHSCCSCGCGVGRLTLIVPSAYRLSLPSLWEWGESNHRSGQILRCWLLQFTSLSLPANVFNPRLLEVMRTALDASISGLSCGNRRRP